MSQATFAECPRCGARVRKEKLRRHINAVHGERAKTAKEATPRPATPKPSTVAFPWVMVGALAAVAAIVVAGYWVLTQAPAGGGPGPSGSPVAVIETNYGTIKVQLDTGRGPRTAGHFMDIAKAGQYNRTTFHRVAANFVIQGGDVIGATNVAWENTGLKNVKYSIAMARSGSADDVTYKDTATSQFFINLNDNTRLDRYAYPYVVFGHVIEGQSVVATIGSLYPPSQPTYDGAPTSPVNILSVTIQS